MGYKSQFAQTGISRGDLWRKSSEPNGRFQADIQAPSVSNLGQPKPAGNRAACARQCLGVLSEADFLGIQRPPIQNRAPATKNKRRSAPPAHGSELPELTGSDRSQTAALGCLTRGLLVIVGAEGGITT
jgi:hypothetical protein